MIFERVVETIKAYQMLSAGDHLIVGVSGGADSVALLSILHRLQKQWKLTLTVAHLNHQLRGEAAHKEAQFVTELANSLGIVCVTEERDVRGYKQRTGCSLQEAARAVRYEFFLELRNRLQAQKIALGHHADDQAETLLMWLIRGTSLTGLAGMQPIRDALFIRPLINVSRVEIESYLEEQQLAYIPDTSAHEQQYLRNKIRHHLLPLLRQEYNPQIVSALSRLSDLLRQDNELLEHMVQQIAGQLFPAETAREISCSIAKLKTYPEALRGRIIKYAIAHITGKRQGIYYRHIQAVCNLIDCTGPAKTVHLPSGWAVVRQYDQLIFTQVRYPHVSYCYVYDNIPERISIDAINQDIWFSVETLTGTYQELLNSEKHVDFLDYNAIKFPLTVRNYQPGDRFHPLGLGGSKKLKDFFIEKKIPRRNRYKIPILLFQEDIAWVGGLRIDDRFRLKPGTIKALKIWIA